MGIHESLLITHLVATVLGVGGATFIEVNLNQALKDNKMDEVERAFMGKAFTVTRVGMVLGLLTGLGFLVEYYVADQLFRIANGIFWAKISMFLIIVVNAYLLHKHKIGLYWGSAFSFVSWWLVMILGTFLTNGVRVIPTNPLLSFLTIMIFYGFCLVIGAQLLHKIRERNKLAT